MKILKQPLSLIAIGSLVCAILVAIIGSVLNPTNALINKMEKAINEQNYELMAEVFAPENIGEYAEEFAEMSNFLGTGNPANISIEFLEGEEIVNEEGIKCVSVVMVMHIGEAVYAVEDTELYIRELNGKEYISFY